MDHYSEYDTEQIIEAAQEGRSVGPVGAHLVGLHRPSEPAGAAPSIAAPSATGRLVRRTAVASAAALMALGGVAAAAGGTDVLDPVFGSDDPVVVVDDLVEAGPEDDGSPDDGNETELPRAPEQDAVSAVEPGEDDVDANADADADEMAVDPTDGLDKIELEILCGGATNHGEYVSAVARDRVGDGEGSHGERVREAAKRECGWDGSDDADEGDADEGDADVGDADDDVDDVGTGPNGNARGHGDEHPSSNAKGNAGGNGNGSGNGNRGNDR